MNDSTKFNRGKVAPQRRSSTCWGALVADAKTAGKFDGTAVVKKPEIKMEFEGVPPEPSEPAYGVVGA
jgi:hypothetical protein